MLSSVFSSVFVSTNRKHYQDLGRGTSSVWNFCARYSAVVLRGLKWRPRETSAVLSGYARRPRRIFPPSSSGDVTFDISSRTTGNEAEESSVSGLVVLAL